MLELAAFTAALSSVGSLIKVATESKNFELTNSLIDLQQKILEIQGSFGELQQKYHQAQQENRDLGDTLSKRSQYEHRLGVVWRKGDSGEYLGPFCPLCQSNGKEVPLKPLSHATPEGPALAMSCQVFHQDGRMSRPIHYVIPKDSLPKDWLYFTTP